jgi:hypothetical protein
MRTTGIANYIGTFCLTFLASRPPGEFDANQTDSLSSNGWKLLTVFYE